MSSTAVKPRVGRRERPDPVSDVLGVGEPEIAVDGQGITPVPDGQVEVTTGPVGLREAVVRAGLFVAVTGLLGEGQRGTVTGERADDVAGGQCRGAQAVDGFDVEAALADLVVQRQRAPVVVVCFGPVARLGLSFSGDQPGNRRGRVLLRGKRLIPRAGRLRQRQRRPDGRRPWWAQGCAVPDGSEWIRLAVVPDTSHRLLKCPRLALLPVKVVASQLLPPPMNSAESRKASPGSRSLGGPRPLRPAPGDAWPAGMCSEHDEAPGHR
jgi:hypothetical protein